MSFLWRLDNISLQVEATLCWTSSVDRHLVGFQVLVVAGNAAVKTVVWISL